jgi:hypothetical protein
MIQRKPPAKRLFTGLAGFPPEPDEKPDVSPPPLTPLQKYMLRVLLFHAGKTIKYRGGICEVVETRPQLRRLMPLVNEDLSEPNPDLFWVPRRAVNRKEMRADRIRRQYSSGLRVAFSGLHYVGDARPDANSIPIESIYRELDDEARHLLRSLGSPESRLTSTSSRETRLMSLFIRTDNLKRALLVQWNKKKREFMENLLVEHLRRSQMTDQRVSACYDVLVGGVALSAVAKQRGLHESHLRQVVNRVVRKVRPAVEAQLSAWVGEEEIQRAASEVGTLETQKAALFNQTPAQVKAEWVASLR